MRSTNLVFKPYKIFNNTNGIFIFCIDTRAIYEIDETTLKVIEQSGKSYDDIYESVSDIYDKVAFDKLVEKMKELDFLEDEDEEKDNEITRSPKMNIFTVTLMLIQNCNMRCSYCYADGGVYNDAGKMDIKTACDAVEFLIEKAKNEKELGVILFGGEPLMAIELIKVLVPYIRMREKEINKKIYINTTTNGTLISREVESFFEEYGIRAMISIDGDKKTHDANRYFANGEGSYDMIIENTRNLRTQKKLSARATVDGKQNLVLTFNHLSDLGFKSIAMSPALNTFTQEDCESFLDNQLEYIDLFLEFVKKKEYDKCRQMKMVFSQVALLDQFYGASGDYSCGAGRTMVAVDYHGDVYPCHRFVSFKEFALGSIYGDLSKREDFLSKIRMSNGHEKCKTCWVKNMCLGYCPYNNFEETTDVSTCSDRACNNTRQTNEKFVNIYLTLSEEDKEQLFSKQNKKSISNITTQ